MLGKGREPFRQFRRECKNKVAWAGEVSVGREGFAPRRTGLIADDDVDATRFKKPSRGTNHGGGICWRREAIHDGADPHAAELFVSGHLRVEHHDPA